MQDMNMDAGQEVQATEEEQAMLEQMFGMALEMIHGEGQSGDAIANMVMQAQDITQGIGQATATVLIGVEKKAGQIPDDIKLPLGQEIVAELSELAVAAGALAEDEVNDGFIDAVVSQAYSEYITLKEQMGTLDPDELEASVSEAEQLMGTSARGGGQQQPQQQPQQQKPRGLLGV
ncbi:hypothetical protein [Arsukibacterium indicum]|uniref:Uncharacterized protein n=1 Tax=Arsukibacterium indicum TaxID=2848612 RepID=A0ABS6MH58_9GAMM|nr:hypothetical protein [Arsukibacterium indicum]MBV2128148.1 hypothetical protein [Arsukibacterium indicum]